MSDAPWDAEQVATLTKLWADGSSCRQIAGVMHLTRNQVIGKVHRLKLAKRRAVGGSAQRKPQQAKPHGQKGQPKVNAIVARAARMPPAPEPFDMEDGAGNDVTALIGIMDLTAHTCRWPVGDPMLPGFGYCGAHTADGPYCPAHTRRSQVQR